MAGKTGFPWLTRQQAATLTGLGIRQFDEAIRPKLDKKAKTGAGKLLRYDATAVAAALVQYRIELMPKPVIAADDDELLGGPSTPGLEKYRLVKVAQEEIKLAQMRGQFVAVEDIEPALTSFASLVRSAGDGLQRKFGPGASVILNDSIDEAVRTLDRFFGDVRSKSTEHEADSPTTDPPARDALPDVAAPDDETVRGGGDHPAGRTGEGLQIPGGSEPVHEALV